MVKGQRWIAETCEVLLKMTRRYFMAKTDLCGKYKLSECQNMKRQLKTHCIVKAQAQDSVDFKRWLINNAVALKF